MAKKVLFDFTIPGLQETNDRITQLDTSLNILQQHLRQLKNTMSQLTELRAIRSDMEKMGEDTTKVSARIRALETSLQELGGAKAYKILKDQSVTLREESKKLNKEMRDQAKAFLESKRAIPKDSIIGLRQELSKLRREYSLLTKEERKTAKGTALLKKMKNLNKEVGRLDRSMGLHRGRILSVGNAFKGLARVMGTVGIILSIRELNRYIGESIKLFSQFERKMSVLEQVSGASGSELSEMERNARKLGETTEFTASRVAELEIAFARLGFTPAEILDTTAAALDAATVSQEDLGRTAQVVGSVLRAFNLDAKESTRVSNVMAKAFNSSALTLEKFHVAMAVVAPVAKNAGASLEFTTAALGKVIDRGVDASTAGTSLRNIFLELGKQGLTFNEAMNMITQSTNKNATALELFGKRGATVATIIATLYDEVLTFGDALVDSEGYAARAAARIRGDLEGSFEKARSAAEGFALNLVEKFAPSIQGVVDLWVEFLTVLNEWLGVPVSERLEEERLQFNALLGVLRDGTLAQEDRNAAITKLTEIYPQYLEGIDLENASTEELLKLQKQVNGEYQVRILFQRQLEEQTKQADKEQKRRDAQIQASETLHRKYNEVLDYLGETAENVSIETAKLMLQEKAHTEVIDAKYQIQNKEAELLSELISAENGYANARNKTNKTIEEGVKLTKEQQDTLELWKIEYPELAESIDKIRAAAAGGEDGIFELTDEIRKLIIEANILKQEIKGANVELFAFTEQGYIGAKAFLELNRDYNATEETMSRLTDALDRLKRRQAELKKEIIDAIAAGRDYTDAWDEYVKVTEDITTLQNEVNRVFGKTEDVLNAAKDSLEAMNKELSTLRDHLKKISTSDVEGQIELIAKIEAQELEINEIKEWHEGVAKRIKTYMQRLADGDVPTITTRFGIAPVWDGDGVTEQLEQSIGQVVEDFYETLSPEGKVNFLEKQLLKDTKALQERTKVELEQAEKAGKGKEEILKRYHDEAKRLEQLAQIEILNVQIAAAEEGSEKQLALIAERNAIEIAMHKNKTDEINKIDEEERKRRKNLILQTMREIADSIVGGIYENLEEQTRAYYQRRVDETTAFYDQEIAAATGNAQLQQELEAEKAARIEELRREEFEKRKKLAIQEVLINKSVAIITTMAREGFIVGKILASTAIAFAAAAEIAAIQSRTFAEGGFTTPIGKRDHTGKRVAGVVHENEYVAPEFQLKAFPHLFEALESDRLQRLNGSKQTLGTNAAEIVNAFAPHGFITGGFTNVAPQIVNPTTVGNTQNQQSTQQMEMFAMHLAEMVAMKTAAAVGAAAKEGSREGAYLGNSESVRLKERQEIANLNGSF